MLSQNCHIHHKTVTAISNVTFTTPRLSKPSQLSHSSQSFQCHNSHNCYSRHNHTTIITENCHMCLKCHNYLSGHISHPSQLPLPFQMSRQSQPSQLLFCLICTIQYTCHNLHIHNCYSYLNCHNHTTVTSVIVITSVVQLQTLGPTVLLEYIDPNLLR